jgi:hypothetical protein
MTIPINKHLLVCDERGTKSMKSRRRTFTLGGIAFRESDQADVISAWENIKQYLCGRKDVELKWSDFFPGHHQKGRLNPLLEQDTSQWRNLAMWALNDLFGQARVFPITTVVRKDRIDEGLLELTRKGKKIIALRFVLGVLLGQFALYLREHTGESGEIWCDELGSQKEQEELENAFASTFDNLEHVLPQFRPYIESVNPSLSFFNSAEKPIIQVADFVSGVIWASSEGDDWFFRKQLEQFAPGRKRTYGIVFLEG